MIHLGMHCFYILRKNPILVHKSINSTTNDQSRKYLLLYGEHHKGMP